MNLFENLQLMKESDTSIVSEFKEFLNNKNAQYIANEIDETKDGMQIVIYDGDWKHEHLYMKRLLDEFFTGKGMDISITSEEIGESDQDTYSARYDIEFNPKSKEYTTDVKPLKFTTESIRYQVTCQLATSNEEIYSEHSNLKDAIASARKAQQSFMNVKIKDLEDGNSWYNIDDAEQDLNDGLYESKHYGGAFDISDTAYFTRDDLDEFSNEVIEQLSNATHADIIANVVDCYLDEDTNELELTLSYNEYEHTHKEKIDMRKIKTPKDLIKAYSHKFVNDFLWSFTADAEHEEMIKESNDKSKEDIERKLIQLIQDKFKYGPLADRAGSSYFYTQGKQHFMAIPISTNSDSSDFYSYKKDLKQVFPKSAIYYDMDDYEMIIDVTNFYRELTESNHNEIKEDYNSDNAGTFEDKLEKELYDAAIKLMTSRKWGFPEDEVKDYLTISVNTEDEDVKVSVGAELTYSSLEELGDELNKIITKYDKDSYFDMECPGRMVAYLFGYKKESINKVEETNHNEILDKDYATGEKIYNALVEYLNSLDQIGMDGKDCDWEPSNFNAKNLNADGEIYLVSGAYILIYPYINEWAEDYFKVCVVEADKLSIQIKNGIENIVNKFKTNKWKLVFES